MARALFGEGALRDVRLFGRRAKAKAGSDLVDHDLDDAAALPTFALAVAMRRYQP